MNIIEGLSKMAQEIASDYPCIESCEPWEQLYAIQSTYEGTVKANEDLHRIIYELCQRFGISPKELIEAPAPSGEVCPDCSWPDGFHETDCPVAMGAASSDEEPGIPYEGTRLVHFGTVSEADAFPCKSWRGDRGHEWYFGRDDNSTFVCRACGVRANEMSTGTASRAEVGHGQGVI